MRIFPSLKKRMSQGPAVFYLYLIRITHYLLIHFEGGPMEEALMYNSQHTE
jgi:hypothetical protein